MAEKDTIAKKLLSNPERAADLFNYAFGHGKRVVTGKDLKLVDPSQYHLTTRKDGETTEDNRYQDLLYEIKFSPSHPANKAFFALEIQSSQARRMPIRIANYWARQYMCQNGEMVLPVFNLVINFSLSSWKGPHRLHKLYSYQDNPIFALSNDFFMDIADPWYITEKDTVIFCSDLGFILYCFKNSNDKDKFYNEALTLFPNTILDEDARLFLKVFLKLELPKVEKMEDNTVCRAVTELKHAWLEQGRVEGIEQGRVEGIEQGRVEGMEQGRVKFMRRYIDSCFENHIPTQEIIRQLVSIFQATSTEITALIPSTATPQN